MPDPLAVVVLAAGAGTRLAPLTRLRPKALCPVGDRTLLDHALDRVEAAAAGGEVAVNVFHGRAAMLAHLAGPRPSTAVVHPSVEEGVARGTAGALGVLHGWVAGRDVLVTNADAHLRDLDLAAFVDGWDRERMRLLCVEDPGRGDFGPLRYCGMALLPGDRVATLSDAPSGLYEVLWRQAAAEGALDLVVHRGAFVDCGTVGDYLGANLIESGGASVIGAGARMGLGAELVRSVVWPGSEVAPGEVLVDAVRAGRLTVLVR